MAATLETIYDANNLTTKSRAERVATLTAAARQSGRALALALDIADRLDALAVEALALSTLGPAVTVGARGRAAGMVSRYQLASSWPCRRAGIA